MNGTKTPTTNEVILQLAAIGRELDERQIQLNGAYDYDRDDSGQLLLDEDGFPYLVCVRRGAKHRLFEAERAHRLAYAKALLEATGNVEERKQKAILDADGAWFELESIRQQVEALKDVIRVLRDRLEIGRSLNSAIKSEWAASGVGQS